MYQLDQINLTKKMTEKVSCPIWGTPAEIISGSTGDGLYIYSSRTAGDYYITLRAQAVLEHRDERLKAKLTSWLVEQRWLGTQVPKILATTIDEANKRRELPVFERADRALRYIQNQTSQIGDTVGLLRNQDAMDGISDSLKEGITPVKIDMSHYYNALTIRAFSESISVREVEFIIDYLSSRQKWIDYGYESNSGICNLTFTGYARLSELAEKDTKSSRAFVAMWFDDSMEDLWKKGIEPGIKDAGYDAVRIDREEHVNKIDDQIIAEIRRSRFVVADFTHGRGGARGGVYYEAGFAHGMNIPVIFSCREDILGDIHFDTRQYNHIVWEKPEELREQLANRIAAVIGDGPNKNGT